MRHALPPLILLLLTQALAAAPKDDFKREGDAEQRKIQAALEGKPPPAIHVKDWMNTGDKPLVLKDLKGKVVVLNVFAEW